MKLKSLRTAQQVRVSPRVTESYFASDRFDIELDEFLVKIRLKGVEAEVFTTIFNVVSFEAEEKREVPPSIREDFLQEKQKVNGTEQDVIEQLSGTPTQAEKEMKQRAEEQSQAQIDAMAQIEAMKANGQAAGKPRKG